MNPRIMLIAGAVIDDGVVNALHIAVRECSHRQRFLLCLPFAIWASFVAASAAEGFSFAAILLGFSSAFLVEVVRAFRLLLLGGLDYLHESSSVFPCHRDDLQSAVFGFR